MHDYQQIIASLRSAYNRKSATNRDKADKDPWKIDARQQFLSLLQQEHKTRLLEIGAGTGADSRFFQDNGLHVVCTDLSPDMVELCREKGLEAYVMDFLSLDFPPASFDALYAMNCLLHVPTADLPTVLRKLQSLLRPGGLFFLAVYGGVEFEGIAPDDWHNPPRFFARHTDEFMQQIMTQFFDLVSFTTKTTPREKWEEHVQLMVLRGKEQQ
ncbi:MAG TPA: class I SAM-dependent methyltransferase [Ktedonosporobacter sp.]|jgi:SAM-dependent methyltransferase|nr:class I SAM-dependent methyltransferase [Ktedonosporobacter sp.]